MRSYSCPIWNEKAWRNLKRFLGVLGVALVISVLLVQFAFAVWVAETDFESSAVGDLSGDTDGTGWSAGWTTCSTNYDIVSSPAQGTRAAAAVNTGDGNACHRSLTTDATSGIFTVSLNTSAAQTAGRWLIQFEDDAVNPEFRVDVSNTAIICNGGGTDYNIVTYSLNTWYKVHVSFNFTTDEWKCRLDSDSAWGATVVGFGLANDVGRIRMVQNDAFTGTLAIDDIGEGSDPAGAAVPPQTPGIIEFNFNIPLPKQTHV